MKFKRMAIWLCTALLIVVLTSSCQPCPEERICPECTKCPVCTEIPNCEEECCDICFGFSGFFVGTNLTDKFQLYKTRFESIDGSDLEIWEVDGYRSLHMPTTGVKITLQCPAYEVLLRLGSWAGGPFDVTAYDGNNNVVDQISVPSDNSFNDITLSGSGIETITITDIGDNEGALERICIHYE